MKEDWDGNYPLPVFKDKKICEYCRKAVPNKGIWGVRQGMVACNKCANNPKNFPTRLMCHCCDKCMAYAPFAGKEN